MHRQSTSVLAQLHFCGDSKKSGTAVKPFPIFNSVLQSEQRSVRRRFRGTFFADGARLFNGGKWPPRFSLGRCLLTQSRFPTQHCAWCRRISLSFKILSRVSDQVIRPKSCESGSQDISSGQRLGCGGFRLLAGGGRCGKKKSGGGKVR